MAGRGTPPRSLRALTRVLLALSLVGGSAVVSANPPASSARRAPSVAPARPDRPAPPRREALLRGFDPLTHELVDGHHVATLAEGRRAVLSLDAGLQAHVTRELERYEVPYGALVALEPSTGRVLAYVSHSSADANAGDLARDAGPPSASVFKIVTASALLEQGVQPSTSVCYGGGLRALTLPDLADDPGRDRRCATLSEAMGSSINAVFAKLADRHLEPAVLRRHAEAFGFGHSLPFDVGTEPSPMDVPSQRLEFARTAAGFWHMHMSPLHGALLAATIANGGEMPRASMVERIEAADGTVLDRFAPSTYRSVIPAAHARAIGQMMQRTVASGTARSAFFDPQGRPFLPGVRVAGKTGTLARERPSYRGYTWWVGFAPADHPRIAVAALVVNTPEWRIKASYLAREALRYYLVQREAGARASR